MGKKAKQEKKATQLSRFGNFPTAKKWYEQAVKREENHNGDISAGRPTPSIRMMPIPTTLESERVLDDDYPVQYDYFYIMDGYLVQCPISGTVRDLKALALREEGQGDIVRNYDYYSRNQNGNA